MSESTRSTEVARAHALALAREALSAVPAGLLADFDGTLSPIVSDPMRSRLVDGAHAALAALGERLAVVAIVTGRAPLDARRMAGVPGVFIAGNHGTEWLEPGSEAPIVVPEAAAMRAEIEDAIGRLPRLEGVVVEDKGSSASVHFRNAPDPDAALASIEHALRGIEAHGLRIGHGRMVVELRPVGLGDKGTAARGIVERFGLRGVVVMGDDITDLDMFRAVGELRRAGSVRAAIIGVGGAGGEVPSEVAEAVDVVLAGPADAAQLLARLG